MMNKNADLFLPSIFLSPFSMNSEVELNVCAGWGMCIQGSSHLWEGRVQLHSLFSVQLCFPEGRGFIFTWRQTTPLCKRGGEGTIVVRYECILCKHYANKSIPSSYGTDEGCDLWRSNLEETHERNPFGIFHQKCFDLPYGNQYFWKQVPNR